MSTKYLPLSKVRFLYPGNYLKDTDLEQIYQSRLNSASSLQTNLRPLLTDKRNYQGNQYPIFVTITFKLMKLMDDFANNSNKIKSIVKQLPGVAQQQFLDSLLLSEITYTNKIEGVQTNEYEISTLIKEGERIKRSDKKEKPQRLRSTVRMYQENLRKIDIKINTLEDFRKIYDRLLAGEIPKEKLPNRTIFRDQLPNNEILSIGSQLKVVHQPPITENEINICLYQLIEFMNNKELPDILKAIITHFFFENTHPFLDGNGRMGRYLFSTYVSRKYDFFTGLSIATAIHSRVETYYRIFREADKLENRAELTFFVEEMLKIIIDQQNKNFEALDEAKEKLEEAKNKIKGQIESLSYLTSNQKIAASQTLIYLAESKLFTSNEHLGIRDEAIKKLNSENKISLRRTQEIIQILEEKSLIKQVSARPKQHVITFL